MKFESACYFDISCKFEKKYLVKRNIELI